jgi:phosphatidate phosphatase
MTYFYDLIFSVWVPALIWYLIGKPFQRGFYCDDTSIRYPYKDSTVTDAELIGYSLSVPILLVKTINKMIEYYDFGSNKICMRNCFFLNRL